MLKTLEEPPPFAHLLLLTDRPAERAADDRSRCQLVRFDAPSAGRSGRARSSATASTRRPRGRARGWRSATASARCAWRSATARRCAPAPRRSRAARSPAGSPRGRGRLLEQARAARRGGRRDRRATRARPTSTCCRPRSASAPSARPTRRNVTTEPDGSFYEAEHLDGGTDMVAVVGTLLAEEARRGAEIPMRPDHGHLPGRRYRQADQPGLLADRPPQGPGRAPGRDAHAWHGSPTRAPPLWPDDFAAPLRLRPPPRRLGGVPPPRLQACYFTSRFASGPGDPDAEHRRSTGRSTT